MPDRSTLKGKRDYVILALLTACALRRNELAMLDVETIQLRERQMGPGRPVREGKTDPYCGGSPMGQAGDPGLDGSGEDRRRQTAAPCLQRRQSAGDGLSDWAIWSVVEQSAKEIGIERFGAHDLRRTCAKLCRKAGGDLEQIKFLLGHSSIQTTERYLGSEQDIAIAVNDSIGLQ